MPSGNRQPIVCVSHDAGFYGAQLLLLHINQVLKTQLGFQVTTVLLGGGELRSQFEQIGEVVDFTDPPWREQVKPGVVQARQREIRRLYQAGARQVICNTSVSGQIVRMFKEAGFRVVVLIHELPTLIRDFGLEGAAREIGRWADCVVFPAAYVRDRFLPISGLDVTHSVIRPQGLYRPSPYRERKQEARSRLLAEMGWSAETRIVVAAGQGDRRKGIDLFCQVAIRVLRENSDARFLWIGDDGSELAKDCKAWLRAAGVDERVHFAGLVQDPDRYLRLLAGADLYLMSSREDPFPSVVLDAMDVGLPVVGFAGAGGFGELLDSGVGVQVPFEDRTAMAAAVAGLIGDPVRASAMGATGQRLIASRFDFPDYVYDLLRLAGLPRHKISVVIPNYNYAHYLPGRLTTILAQTYRPYEIIFLDDHSSDTSVAVAESLLSGSGLPYRIIRNETNRGCYAQWLSGIEMARGDLVWIAEADDECEPTFLQELVAGFDNPDVVLSYAQSRKIDQDGQITSPNYLDYTNDLSKSKWGEAYCRAGVSEIGDTLAIKNTIPNASAVLMKKPDLSGIKSRLLQLRNAGDWLTYVHILESGSIAFTPKVLNSHRVHLGGVTRGGNALRHMSEIIQVQEYVRSRHVLAQETLERIERMRQFTYEYLGLAVDGPKAYRDHPELRTALNGNADEVVAATRCVDGEADS